MQCYITYQVQSQKLFLKMYIAYPSLLCKRERASFSKATISFELALFTVIWKKNIPGFWFILSLSNPSHNMLTSYNVILITKQSTFNEGNWFGSPVNVHSFWIRAKPEWRQWPKISCFQSVYFQRLLNVSRFFLSWNITLNIFFLTDGSIYSYDYLFAILQHSRSQKIYIFRWFANLTWEMSKALNFKSPTLVIL